MTAFARRRAKTADLHRQEAACITSSSVEQLSQLRLLCHRKITRFFFPKIRPSISSESLSVRVRTVRYHLFIKFLPTISGNCPACFFSSCVPSDAHSRQLAPDKLLKVSRFVVVCGNERDFPHLVRPTGSHRRSKFSNRSILARRNHIIPYRG